MKELKIEWQRLTADGETCTRCGGTEAELEQAVSNLKDSLKTLGVKVNLNKEKISEEEFKNSPLKSNMIEINDKPLEEWVNGETGASECCEICAPNDCRTITVEGETYEKIPASLIIKGGLAAASDMISEISKTSGSSCCEETVSDSGCC